MASVECLIGLKTDNFVLLAADANATLFGRIIISDESDKFFELGDKLGMICAGEGGQPLQFGNYVEKNLKLYKFRNGYEMRPHSAEHWIRKQVADNLRTNDQYLVETIIGGYDECEKRAYLGSIDFYGASMSDQPFLFRGFAGKFCTSFLTEIYRHDMTLEEGLAALKHCLNEIKRRCIVSYIKFGVKVIDENGIRKLDDIIPDN